MPGPWFLPREDQGAWSALPAARGDYVELKLLDSTRHPQGMGLVRIEERENPGRYGEWFAGTIVAVSDGYLQWWLDEGEGSSEQRWFSFHVCAKSPATCRGSKGHPDMEFHFESLRSIPLAELGTSQQPPWLTQPAAAADLRWELDRLGGQPTTPAAAEAKGGKKEREKGLAAPSWGGPPGAEAKPPGLAAELDDLARDLKDPGQGRRDKRKNRRQRIPCAGERLRASCGGGGRPREKEETLAGPGRSPKPDRGPFGGGVKVDLGEDGSSSDSSFREASSSRDRQLQLLEYSERYPGRLSARLLQKMRMLLARDGGALNFAAREDPAPPVATSYLLTIMVPEYRTKVGVRLLRELKTLCKALDLVVEGEARRAADLLAQRVKAIEASLADDHWLKAQFLELVPREGSLLMETDEAVMAARQLALETKVKEAGQRNWGRGKGQWFARPDDNEPPPLRTTPPEGEKGKKGEGKKGAKGKKGQKKPPKARTKQKVKKEVKGGKTPDDDPPGDPDDDGGPPDEWDEEEEGEEEAPADDPAVEERGAPQGSTPAAAETLSPGQEEEWDDELLEALGVSEDEDTLRDSLEHAAKHAATGWWNLSHLQAAVRRLLGTKPTWEQFLEWFMNEGRRFPTPLGSFFRRMEETEAAPPGAEPTREHDLLPIHVDATCNIEVVENCSQVVLETTLHALNFHYCCGWISPVCWPPPEEVTPRQAEAVKGIAKICAGCLGRGLPLGGPAEAEKILSSRSRDYEGNMVERVGEIQADLVIGAWPNVGEAAVASVVDFLSGDALHAVISPKPHFKRGSDQPRTSKKGKVHASQEEWNKVVSAAFQRNMMGPVDESAVPRDAQGHLITNGAGAVEKRKLVGGKEVTMQRFIFVPINEYLEALPGDQDFLPYVAQLGLLLLDDSQTLMIESEDLTSAFNLFRMPDTWPAPVLLLRQEGARAHYGVQRGVGQTGAKGHPNGAVTIMQAVLRNLVFDKAGVPASLEISKVKEIPAEGGAVLYLDSFDQVRMVDTTLRAVEEGVASPEHERFRAACKERGLPLNASKSLAGALRGGIQGGVLDGDKGTIWVGSDKAEKLVLATLGLLASASWSEAALRRWAGIATFVAAFRRPLFAVFQEIFPLIERAKDGAVDPDPQVIDEMVTFVLLLPLASTSLRARVERPLPRRPGGPLLRQWKRMSLESVALNKVAVLTAFGPNVNDKDDFWSPTGKEKLERMEADPLVAAKFWSPPFNTFGLGRGEQVQLQSGRWVEAPPALRSGGHLTGVAGLSKAAAFEVRRANTLALKALKTLSRAVEENFLCFVCQPWDSYLWYFLEAEELKETRGIFSTSFPLCCFGGPKRWVELLHNSPAVHQALHRPACRDHEEEHKAWYDSTGRIRFACCEELRLPWDLCDAMALAIKRDLAEICPLIPGKLTDRTMEWQLMAQLRGASSSLRSPAAAEAASEVIAPIAREILEDPLEHLRRMLSRGHYRGTEVRLMAPNEPDNLKMVPYPAHLWRWRNTLSFAWHNEDNITTLEMLAALAEVRRRARQLNTQRTRFFHILDSQVVYHIMAKGRAHSKRLNRLARRMMAVQLAAQLQTLALWTISAWNFADTASRRFAPHHGS
ncbi:unnamed protein product [Symbiodinium sp. CCMP2592]|nr:unnamed protein product [Symbiodinium sp. CCMP2592]